MRAAFRVGYRAEGFFGYATQPGKPTVHKLLEEGLRRSQALSPTARVAVASRTDRGVHALGNVIAFDSPLSAPSVASLLNALDPRIFCFGYAHVPAGFDPRHARSRWYRYFLPAEGHDEARLARVARLFEGEHDFASFSRRDNPPRETRRSLTRCTIHPEGRYLALDLVAPSFLWGQVRKIVASMLYVEEGRLAAETIEEALLGPVSLTLPLAPPERLVLMDVAYDFPFTPVGGRLARRRGALDESLAEVELKAKLLGLFREAVTEGPPRLSADSG